MTPKKEYYRIDKEARKKLKQIVKDIHPGEYSYMLDMMITMITWMRDFYKNGYGVYGMDKCEEDPKNWGNVPTRLQTLNMAIQLYNRWQQCEDEYFPFVSKDLIEVYKSNGYNYKESSLSLAERMNFLQHQNEVFMFKGNTYQEAISAFNKEYSKRRKAFFDYFSEHVEEWWD